jgi:hypothetical protein
MLDREYGWSDAGKVSATVNGVTEREVVDTLFSSQRLEHQVGDLLLAVAGLAGTLRVIIVLCERAAAGTVWSGNTWAVIAARPATTDETKLWLEGTTP